MRRGAFSLIELVLAIVIISISVMTVPMMLSQSAKNDNFSLMQESILAARTKMGNILSYIWDDKALDANSTMIVVLDVKNGDSELDRNATTLNTNRRIGHIPKDKRRHMMDGNMTSETFPSTSVDTNITDINDFDNKTVTIAFSGTGSPTDSFDYLDKNLTLGTKVYYISDMSDYNQTTVTFDFNISNKQSITDLNNSTNIKMIELNVTSQNYQPFIFRTFSCNIGQAKYLYRMAN